MLTHKNFTTKQFVESLIENKKMIEMQNKQNASETARQEKFIFEANENIIKMQITAENAATKKRVFIENVKTALLAECIYKIYNESQGISIVNDGDESIKRSLVNGFIKENGVNNLLSKFKYTSNLLSEMSLLVSKYSKSILEKAEEEKEYCIDADCKDDFFKDLNLLDTGEAIETIRMRVANAVDEFIQNNINNKMDIEDTLNTVKEKIALTKDESVKESYSIMAKRKITDIRNKKKTIFEAMVYNLSNKILTNDAMKNEYMVENKINMDKVVERTKILYSFLETVNTLKMDNINEEYLKNIIE